MTHGDGQALRWRRASLLLLAGLLAACGTANSSPSASGTFATAPPSAIVAASLPPTASPSPSATPAGEHWSGTVDASSYVVFHTSEGGFLECTENWLLTPSFAVDDAGAITGSGTGTLVGLENCHSNFGNEFDNALTLSFSITGSETDSELSLQFHETAVSGALEGLLNYTMFLTAGAGPPPVMLVPRVPPDRAEGTVTVSVTVDNGEMATGTHQFHLVCLDCGPQT